MIVYLSVCLFAESYYTNFHDQMVRKRWLEIRNKSKIVH